MGCGHPCIGCTEQGVGFAKPIHTLAKVKNVEPPVSYPGIVENQGKGVTVGAAAVLAAVAGAAAGATAVFSRKLGKSNEQASAEDGKPQDRTGRV